MTRGACTSYWEGGLGCRNKVKMNRYCVIDGQAHMQGFHAHTQAWHVYTI